MLSYPLLLLRVVSCRHATFCVTPSCRTPVALLSFLPVHFLSPFPVAFLSPSCCLPAVFLPLRCCLPVASLSLPCCPTWYPVALLSLACRLPVACLSPSCRLPIASLSPPCRPMCYLIAPRCIPRACPSLSCGLPVAYLSLPCHFPAACLSHFWRSLVRERKKPCSYCDPSLLPCLSPSCGCQASPLLLSHANPLYVLHQQPHPLPLPVLFTLGGGGFAVPSPPQVATTNQSRLPRPIVNCQLFQRKHRANVGPNQHQTHKQDTMLLSNLAN